MSYRDKDIFESIISANFADELHSKYNDKFEEIDHRKNSPQIFRVFANTQQKVISFLSIAVIQIILVTLLLVNFKIAALIWLILSTLVLILYLSKEPRYVPPEKKSKVSLRWNAFMKKQEEYYEKRRLENK